MNLDALAKQYGGSVATPTPDLDSLAKQFGGSAAGATSDVDKLAQQFGGAPATEESGFLRQAADVPVSIAKGVVQGVRMIADAFGAGSDTSKTIKGAEDYLTGLLSAEAKGDQQAIARIMKEAEDKGAAEQVKAAFRAFSQAPVDLISQGLGTAGPVILAALGTKLLGAPALIVKGTGLALGAGMGAGAVKGTIYEETKKALVDAGTPEDQAEARAKLAQEYGGKNLDMILAGTALGGLASTTGVEKALIGPLSKRILARAGVKEAAEAAAKPAAVETAKGLPRRVATGAAAEAAPEVLQASQEKLAENIAQQREGLATPTMRGVVGAGTLEGIVGGGLGATVAAATPRERAPVAPPPAKEPTTAEEMSELLFGQLTALGLPEAEARTIADNQAKQFFEATQERVGETVPTSETGRLEEKVQEFIGAGFSPEEARTRAEAAIAEEDEADALAETPTEVAEDVAGTVERPSGAGVSVAEQQGDGVPTAEGVAESERTGVVPTGPDVAGAVEGEGREPVAVTAEEQAKEDFAEWEPLTDPTAAPYEGAKKRNGYWVSRDGAYSAIPTGGYGFRVVPNAVADFMSEHGFGTSHLNDVAARAAEAALQGKPVDQYFTKLSEELTDLMGEQGAATTLAQFKTAFDSTFTTEGAPVGTETAEAVQTETQGQEAAAPTVKRGRPALTPEEKAQREPKQKAAKAAAKKSDSEVAKLNALLDAKLDPDNFDTDEAFGEAQANLNNARAAALRSLLMLEPTVRGTAAGKRLKAALARPEIPAKQLADVRQGVELARKGPSRAEAVTESVVSEPNEGFKANTNGVQSLGTIIKGRAPSALKAIAQRIRAANAGVKFQVIEKGDPLPPVLEKYAADWDAARGLFIQNDATGERSIYVKGSSYGADQGANDITVLHENLHAATNQKLNLGLQAIQRGFSENSKLVRATRDLQDLMRRVGDEMARLDARGQLPPAVGRLFQATNGNIVGDVREFLAYGMSDPDFQDFLMTVRGVEQETSFFTRFVDVVRRLLGMDEDATNALTDLIVVTDKIISARKTPTMYFLERAERRKAVLEGKAEKVSAAKKAPKKPGELRTEKEIEKDVAIAKEKVRISFEGEGKTLAKQIKEALVQRDAGKALDVLKTAWQSMSSVQREAAVRLPTMDFLTEWMGKEIPRLKEVNTYIKDMNGMATSFLEGNAQLLKAMQRAFEVDPELQTKLSKLVYESTLARIDPSNPNAKERSPTLSADYAALGASGQALYKTMRTYYKGVHELYRLLLDQQVQNLSGVTQEVKDNILAKIRQAYEKGDAIEPYFPLVRRGDYWLSVGTGRNRQFYMFESQVARDAKAKELAAERRTSLEELLDEQKFDMGNNVGSLRKASVGRDTSGVLTAVFNQIDQQDFMAEGAREGLKDAVYQIYLQTMPEQSFRNMFIHRKGLAGFSPDLLRNTATTASRMSMQLARLKYASLIRNSMSAARDSIVGRPELLPFVDEMDRRSDMALSGKEGDWTQTVAGAANKASYIWYLSSASSALIQPFSILISGVPVLAANHNNSLGASAEIAKAISSIRQYGIVKKNIDGTTSYVAPSLANSDRLTPDERKAVREMARRGVQQSTYSSLVFEYKNNASAELEGTLNKGAELGKMLVGGLMHNTERLTREALYIASYRLGRKRGLNFQEAVDQAVVDVNEALADYDISNRPRWMQEGLGRIAFQFKMYPLHMMLLLATNFKRMLPFLNKEGKAAAAKKFFGIIGATGMLAGVAGLPGFSAMMGVAAWAMKQMADDDELPDEFKDKDPETYFRAVVLPELLGDVKLGGVPLSDLVSADTVDRGLLNRLTGKDFSSRLGLNDIVFRDGKEMRTARESAVAFAIDTFGGPTASLILQMVDAYEAFMYGDVQKGLEKMSPALIRNLLVANKYQEEGIKTARGAELIPKDDVTAGMLWAQAIGFRPDAVAVVQQRNFKMTGAEQKVVFERDELLKKINIAYQQAEKSGDYDRFDKLTEQEVDKFNRKNPEYKIGGKDITESINNKAKSRDSAQAGYVLNKKNARLFEDVVDRNMKVLEDAKK